MQQCTQIRKKLRKENDSYLLSYIAIRRLIGIMGMTLPFVCIIGGLLQNPFHVLDTVSAYYHSAMRDYFVGLLFLLGIFLFCYRGYTLLDNIAAGAAGFCALGTALFPVAGNQPETARIGIFCLYPHVSEIFHVVCAGSFLLILSYISLFLFTRHGTCVTPRKRIRNRLYRISGILLILSVLLIGVYPVCFKNTVIAAFYPVLILESIAFVSFGIAWLVKGDTIGQDLSET